MSDKSPQVTHVTRLARAGNPPISITERFPFLEFDPNDKSKQRAQSMRDQASFDAVMIEYISTNKLMVSKKCPTVLGKSTHRLEGVTDFVLQADGHIIMDLYFPIAQLTHQTMLELDRFKKFRGRKGHLDARIVPIVYTCIPSTSEYNSQHNLSAIKLPTIQPPTIANEDTSSPTQLSDPSCRTSVSTGASDGVERMTIIMRMLHGNCLSTTNTKSSTNKNINTLADTLRSNRRVTDNNILKWTQQVLATLHSSFLGFHTLGFISAEDVLLVSDESITAQLEDPAKIAGAHNAGKRLFFDIPYYFKGNDLGDPNAGQLSSSFASSSSSLLPNILATESSASINTINSTVSPKSKKELIFPVDKFFDNLELCQQSFMPHDRNAWIDVHSKFLNRKPRAMEVIQCQSTLPDSYFQPSVIRSYNAQDVLKTHPKFYADLASLDRKGRSGSIFIASNSRPRDAELLEGMYNQYIKEVQGNMRQLGVIILQLLQRREFNQFEVYKYIHMDIILFDAAALVAEEEAKKKKIESMQQEQETSAGVNSKNSNNLDIFGGDSDNDSDDDDNEYINSKDKQHGKSPRKIDRKGRRHAMVVKKRQVEELLKLRKKLNTANNAGDRWEVAMDQLDEMIPSLPFANKWLRELIQLCFQPFVTPSRKEGGTNLQVDIFHKYKHVLEGLRKIVLSNDEATRYEKPVTWTKEDEERRLEDIEDRKNELDKKAIEGLIATNKRLKLERRKLWFELLPEHVKALILRKRAAREQARVNRLERKRLLHYASFHHWTSDVLHRWLLAAVFHAYKHARTLQENSRYLTKDFKGSKFNQPKTSGGGPSRPASRGSTPGGGAEGQQSQQPAKTASKASTLIKKEVEVVKLDVFDEQRMKECIDCLQPIIIPVHQFKGMTIPARAHRWPFQDRLKYQDETAKILFHDIFDQLVNKLTASNLYKAISQAKEETMAKLAGSNLTKILKPWQLQFKMKSLTAGYLCPKLGVVKKAIFRFAESITFRDADWANEVLYFIALSIVIKFDEEECHRIEGEKIALSRLIGCYEIIKLKKIIKMIVWQSKVLLDLEMEAEKLLAQQLAEEETNRRLEEAKNNTGANVDLASLITSDSNRGEDQEKKNEELEKSNKKLAEIIWGKSKEKKAYEEPLDKMLVQSLQRLPFEHILFPWQAPEDLAIVAEIKQKMVKRATIGIRITGSLAQSLFVASTEEGYFAALHFLSAAAIVLRHPKRRVARSTPIGKPHADQREEEHIQGKLLVFLYDSRQLLVQEAVQASATEFYKRLSCMENDNEIAVSIYQSVYCPRYLFGHERVKIGNQDINLLTAVSSKERFPLPLQVPAAVVVSKPAAITPPYISRDFIDISVSQLCHDGSYEVMIMSAESLLPRSPKELKEQKYIVHSASFRIVRYATLGRGEAKFSVDSVVRTNPGIPDSLDISQVATEVFVDKAINRQGQDNTRSTRWKVCADVPAQCDLKESEQMDGDLKWEIKVQLRNFADLKSDNGAKIVSYSIQRRFVLSTSSSPSSSSCFKTSWLSACPAVIDGSSTCFEDTILLPQDVKSIEDQIFRTLPPATTSAVWLFNVSVEYRIACKNGFGSTPYSDSVLVSLSSPFSSSSSSSSSTSHPIRLQLRSENQSVQPLLEDDGVGGKDVLDTIYTNINYTKKRPEGVSLSTVNLAGQLISSEPITLFSSSIDNSDDHHQKNKKKNIIPMNYERFEDIRKQIAFQQELQQSEKKRVRPKSLALSQSLKLFTSALDLESANTRNHDAKSNSSTDPFANSTDVSLSSSELLQLYFTRDRNSHLKKPKNTRKQEKMERSLPSITKQTHRSTPIGNMKSEMKVRGLLSKKAGSDVLEDNDVGESMTWHFFPSIIAKIDAREASAMSEVEEDEEEDEAVDQDVESGDLQVNSSLAQQISNHDHNHDHSNERSRETTSSDHSYNDEEANWMEKLLNALPLNT